MNKDKALGHLLDLLSVEGLGGQESKVAAAIAKKLTAAGVKKAWITTDDAHKRLGVPPSEGALAKRCERFETGNLIVKLPGTVKAPRILFSAHMDTVPLCRGAVPVVGGVLRA